MDGVCSGGVREQLVDLNLENLTQRLVRIIIRYGTAKGFLLSVAEMRTGLAFPFSDAVLFSGIIRLAKSFLLRQDAFSFEDYSFLGSALFC